MTKDLNDVIAKLTLNWLTDLTDLQAEGGFLKFSDHGTSAEPSQIAALLARACVGGHSLREFGEIRSVLQERKNALCFAQIFHKNMTRPNLFLGTRRIFGDLLLEFFSQELIFVGGA